MGNGTKDGGAARNPGTLEERIAALEDRQTVMVAAVAEAVAEVRRVLDEPRRARGQTLSLG